jgi:hypothetical protein
MVDDSERYFVCGCFLEDDPDIDLRLRRCGGDARRGRVPPETLVVALRDAWLAQPKYLKSAPEYSLLTGYIHIALEAYYKDATSERP